MSLFAAADGLAGLLPQAGAERDAWRAWHRCITWVNAAAVATTATVAEFAVYSATRKEKLIAARYIPSSGAVTGNASYFSLLIGKRTLAAPTSLINLITYNADATPAKDIVQWGFRDLFLVDAVDTTTTDYIFGSGDTLTLSVTKTTSMTFPAGTVELIFEPRD